MKPSQRNHRNNQSHDAVSLPTAPASLLLLGEYAVLEPGGIGVAVAPEARVVAHAGSGNQHGVRTGPKGPPRLVGRFPHGEERWPGDGFLNRVCAFLENQIGAPRFTGEIVIDSSALYGKDGKKQGFGSSAAVTVVATSLWLQESDHHAVLQVATEAHRHAQGGRGSGYDVACSTYGSTIRFTGGPRPKVAPVSLPWLPELTLFAGPEPVGTPSAISLYQRWKADNPEGATEFLRESNRLVASFLAAEEWEVARPIFAACCELAAGLGEVIGVSARMDPPGKLLEGEWKAIGAGNELGVVLGARNRVHSDIGTAVTIAEDGVRWQ